MTYLITRHPGALQWLQKQLLEPSVHIVHLNQLDHIGQGDYVIGTLPVNLIADICARGACYLHLEIKLPEHLRGQELSAEQMTACGAELIEYVAYRPLPDEAVLEQAKLREV